MPSRNIRRIDTHDSYYHVYNRGINKADVFCDAEDKSYFLFLISRHLSKKQSISKKGYLYPHYRGQLELLAYCLMDNHYHLLFYQAKAGVLPRMMQSVSLAYLAYFNRKYNRTGPLFGNRFMASRITNDAYSLHISRYIHLNPRSWKYFQYSSLRYIRKGSEPEWLQTERLLEPYKDRNEYLEFVADYEDNKLMLEQIKYDLANL